MGESIEVQWLRDVDHGGAPDQAEQVAAQLAQFVGAAEGSVDLAIYDFRLSDPALVSTVASAFTDAAARGVRVRIAYDAGKPVDATTETFARLEADPAPPGTADWIAEHFGGTAVTVAPIQAAPQLMHSKYLVRDSASAATAAVWTGSTNFTDDAWNLQENNIVRITDAAVAAAYQQDFDEMWASGRIRGTGAGDAGSTPIDGGTVGWDFSPGDGAAMNAALAASVDRAATRIQLAAMVLTSHQVLAALAAARRRGVAISGIYDGGQMRPIARQWRSSPGSAAVLADWTTVSALLVAKPSTPYTPTGPHDFMHLKVLLADEEVVTGSYNFSANAERNAENQLRLTDPAIVEDYSATIDAITAAYSAEVGDPSLRRRPATRRSAG